MEMKINKIKQETDRLKKSLTGQVAYLTRLEDEGMFSSIEIVKMLEVVKASTETAYTALINCCIRNQCTELDVIRETIVHLLHHAQSGDITKMQKASEDLTDRLEISEEEVKYPKFDIL